MRLTRDRKAWREADKSFGAAFSNLNVKVLDQAADGDKVATRWVIFDVAGPMQQLRPPASDHRAQGVSRRFQVTTVSDHREANLARHPRVGRSGRD